MSEPGRDNVEMAASVICFGVCLFFPSDEDERSK